VHSSFYPVIGGKIVDSAMGKRPEEFKEKWTWKKRTLSLMMAIGLASSTQSSQSEQVRREHEHQQQLREPHMRNMVALSSTESGG